MNNYVIFILGVICAGIGGELFIRGTIGLARWLRVSAGIIGITITAFATSSPELSVAINSAIEGKPQIALGDALGSNVVNVALILGIALCFGKIKANRNDLIPNYIVLLISPIILAIFALDSLISRFDGIIMLVIFALWITKVTIDAYKQRDDSDTATNKTNEWLSIVLGLIGLGLLIAAGRLIVVSASSIAQILNVDRFIIGAVIVAFGTSVPELATILISKIKGHDDIGINTIFGSNIFNGLFIIGIASTICPIVLSKTEVFIVLAFGIISSAMTLPSHKGHLDRWRGVLLLSVYISFIFVSFLYK